MTKGEIKYGIGADLNRLIKRSNYRFSRLDRSKNGFPPETKPPRRNLERLKVKRKNAEPSLIFDSRVDNFPRDSFG